MTCDGEVRSAVVRRRERKRLLALAPGVRIDPTVYVRAPQRLMLGAGMFIDAGAVLRCGGQDWCPPDGGITICADSYVGPNAVLFGGAGIEISDAALISPGVVITSPQHSFDTAEVDIREQPLCFGRVVIERDVWIGANATVLPGIRIGHGSVVGAGAVVGHDVEPGKVVLGVPERVMRAR